MHFYSAKPEISRSLSVETKSLVHRVTTRTLEHNTNIILIWSGFTKIFIIAIYSCPKSWRSKMHMTGPTQEAPLKAAHHSSSPNRPLFLWNTFPSLCLTFPSSRTVFFKKGFWGKSCEYFRLQQVTHQKGSEAGTGHTVLWGGSPAFHRGQRLILFSSMKTLEHIFSDNRGMGHFLQQRPFHKKIHKNWSWTLLLP